MRQFSHLHLHLHLIYTAILLLLFLFLLRPSTSDLVSDRAALVALRAAVGGRVLLWNLSNPTPCSWAGVLCSPDSSSVIELRLPGMGLSGTLPANTISNLTNLQKLSLRYNALSGPLPADLFSSLSFLRSLYLHQNFFSGEIPDSLFSHKSLIRVNLAENNFSGPISSGFNNLTRLGTLYLQENHFSGLIPDLDLPRLVQFNVSYNNLTGKIPKGLSGKPKSSFLGNSLCGDPLDNSCGSERHKKKLSGAAIAGIVVGSVLGLVLILLLVFCMCRKLGTKEVGRKDGAFRDKEIEVSMERTMESRGNDSTRAKEKEKGEINVISAGKKGLVTLGNIGWNFDLEDLLRASAEVLGKGTFGTAYKAVLETGLTVTVKRLGDVNMGEKEFREKMEVIGKMDHENLVPLRAYYYNMHEKLLVYDYMPMGSLSALLHGNKGAGRTPLNWETRVAIALGVAQGVSFLHSQGPKTSHGSIKSSNILLTRSYEARVSDFGLAQLARPPSTPNRVLGYRAPEVTDPCKVSQKADVYSFGVLLLELLTCKAPTRDEGVDDLPRWVESVVKDEWIAEVFDLDLLRYQNVEEDMVRLLQLAVDCAAQYPDKRPSMAEVSSKIEEIYHSSLHDPSSDIVNVVSASPTP